MSGGMSGGVTGGVTGAWVDQLLPSALKRSHLVNFLGSVGGIGRGRGLLELSSRWWRGELGMGSRRLGWAGGRGGGCGGCPLPEPATPTPTPVASTALTIGELLNLLLDVFSFFLFCYVEKQKEKRRCMGGQKGSSEQKKKLTRRNGEKGEKKKEN